MARIQTTCECGCVHGIEYGGGKIEKVLLTRTCFVCKKTVSFQDIDTSEEKAVYAAEEKPKKSEEKATRKRGRPKKQK